MATMFWGFSFWNQSQFIKKSSYNLRISKIIVCLRRRKNRQTKLENPDSRLVWYVLICTYTNTLNKVHTVVEMTQMRNKKNKRNRRTNLWMIAKGSCERSMKNKKLKEQTTFEPEYTRTWSLFVTSIIIEGIPSMINLHIYWMISLLGWYSWSIQYITVLILINRQDR